MVKHGGPAGFYTENVVITNYDHIDPCCFKLIKIKDLNDVKIDVGPLAQLPSPPTLRTPILELARVKPRFTLVYLGSPRLASAYLAYPSLT